MTARPVDYGGETDKDRRYNIKDNTLRKNPDVLFYDTLRNNSTCNLIFITDFPAEWKAAIFDQYPETEEIKLKDKVDLKLGGKTGEKGKKGKKGKKGNINIYPSGKFVIQGKENHLDEFDQLFNPLKDQMNNKRLANKQMKQEPHG